MNPPDSNAEWIEADGKGGFASGTVSGARTRRYQALLLTATTPPAGRVVLVNGFDAWIETSDGSFAISSQRYGGDVIHPDGASRIDSFEYEPWPRWRFRITDKVVVEQEIFVPHGESVVFLSWRIVSSAAASLKLKVRPFFSGRDFHSTHHENGSFRFEAKLAGESVRWHAYEGLPAVIAPSTGHYHHDPVWYRNFLYTEEVARGLDATEDLAAPGTFEFQLTHDSSVLALAAEGHATTEFADVKTRYAEVKASELARRAKFASPLERAADAYLVERGHGKTLIAGYPWFGDWGRDTFIAIRGLCIATGRLEEARDILVQWAGAVSEGMLPNRFPDRGEQPEFNSVDASLWYVIAVNEYLIAAEKRAGFTDDCHTAKLRGAIEQILYGYATGTRFGIRADDDGLLAAGEPGQQLTWMDARVDGREITPRIGKPVEVEALWLNALAIGARFAPDWAQMLEQGLASFRNRFWNEGAGSLADVVDCDHQPGTSDLTFRPNQIFAIGGLPLILVPQEQARRVVDAVEARLLTPLGLRSLAPNESGYVPHYGGSVAQRDGSYHQGTVWPWLIGPFVEAWVRVRGSTIEAKREARDRFLSPLHYHLGTAGLGHISEIADAALPHTARGCPFQAWSLGELLRLEQVVLAENS